MSDSKTVKVVKPTPVATRRSAAYETEGLRTSVVPVHAVNRTSKKITYRKTEYPKDSQGRIITRSGKVMDAQVMSGVNRPVVALRSDAPAILSKEIERAIAGVVGGQIEANMAQNTEKLDELLSVLKSANQKIRRQIPDLDGDRY